MRERVYQSQSVSNWFGRIYYIKFVEQTISTFLMPLNSDLTCVMYINCKCTSVSSDPCITELCALEYCVIVLA